MPDEEDMITERHAHVLAYDYNLAPRVTKCERTVGVGNDVCSMWLCRKDRTVRCLVLYHADQLEPDE